MLREHQFRLGAILRAVAAIAGLLAIFRLDATCGLIVLLIPLGVWFGRVLGAKNNHRAVGGMVGGTVSALLFLLSFGVFSFQGFRFFRPAIGIPLILVSSAVMGAGLGSVTELLTKLATRRKSWKTRVLIALCLPLVGIQLLSWTAKSYRKHQASSAIQRLNGRALERVRMGLLQFGDLTDVYFLGPQLTDDNLDVLDKVRDLRVLSLVNTAVTDEGLSQLADHAELNVISIGYIDVTDLVGDGAAHVNSPPRLTGKGLATLSNLPNLRSIQLIGAPMTDEELESLCVLTNLSFLDLKDTKVTDAGVAKFKKALPNCRVDLR